MALLDGKVAVVTGETAASAAASARLSTARVRRSSSTARDAGDAADAAKKIGPRAHGVICDVRAYESVQRLFRETQRIAGGVDVLVNNAGIGLFAPSPTRSPRTGGR